MLQLLGSSSTNAATDNTETKGYSYASMFPKDLSWNWPVPWLQISFPSKPYLTTPPHSPYYPSDNPYSSSKIEHRARFFQKVFPIQPRQSSLTTLLLHLCTQHEPFWIWESHRLKLPNLSTWSPHPRDREPFAKSRMVSSTSTALPPFHSKHSCCSHLRKAITSQDPKICVCQDWSEHIRPRSQGVVRPKGSEPGFCAGTRKPLVKSSEQCEAIIAFSLVFKKHGKSHVLPSVLVEISSSRLTALWSPVVGRH